MDDYEYAPEVSRPSRLVLDRHLTVGRNRYRLIASGTGDQRIGLTVTGRDDDGIVVSEISGGISLDDLPAVAELVSSALDGLVAVSRPGRTPPPSKRFPNQGARWSAEDDARLVRRHREGAAEPALMAEFSRSRGGIRARLERLERLGEIAPSQPPPGGIGAEAT
jgi:hypothetical protein